MDSLLLLIFLVLGCTQGGNPFIHLVFSDSEPNVICNPVEHIAFEATGFEETKQRLVNEN